MLSDEHEREHADGPCSLGNFPDNRSSKRRRLDSFHQRKAESASRRQAESQHTPQKFKHDGVEVVFAKFGWSLRSTRPFTKGEILTQYCGTILTQEEIDSLSSDKKTHIVTFHDQGGGGIDGLKTPINGVGLGSFSHHSDFPNAFFFRECDGIFLKASVDIPYKKWITVANANSCNRGSCKDIE
jgi:hypothetical protein